MAGIRVGKGSCLVIPVHLLPARAARRITLEGNIKIHLDFPVCIPVRQVNAVQAYIRYGAGMPRLAALVLACGQRECGIGQRIIQFVRHGFAALHADEIFRVQRERIRRIFGKSLFAALNAFGIIFALRLSLVLFSLGNDGRSGGFGFPDIHRFGGGSGGLRRILRALDVLCAVVQVRAPSAPHTGQSSFMASAVQAVSQMHTGAASPPSSAKAGMGSVESTMTNTSRMLSSRFFIAVPFLSVLRVSRTPRGTHGQRHSGMVYASPV